MMDKKIDKLLELSKNGKQIWVGLRPPFPMDVSDLLGCTNFRLPANNHGQYDVVWLYEHALSDICNNGWKIVIDECIRLLGTSGRLVIRCKDNDKLTMVSIKHFLGRRHNLDVDIDFEIFDSDTAETITCFMIKRKNYNIYQDKIWTFCILTSGKKRENVVSFLKSVRNNEKTKSQIIISGPKNTLYDEFDVSYLDLSDFRDEDYAEISKKKNALSAIAKNENILIAHDRFVLNADFFDGFEQFGYDFDFLTVNQFYESGKEYPAYCCLEKEGLVWARPFHIGNLNQLYSTQYLNGGLLIFKKKTLDEIGFNSLLMWNQMEDVEICLEFMNRGIVPRFNYFSSAKTIGVDEEYTKTFLEYEKDMIILPDPLCINAGKIEQMRSNNVFRRVASRLPGGVKGTRMYIKIRDILVNKGK